MDVSLVYLIALIGLVLSINAQGKLREYKRRIEELEEPIKQKKRDAVLLARAEMLMAEDKSKKVRD